MWPFKKKNFVSKLPEKPIQLIHAFTWRGTKYFSFKNAFQMTTGRGLMAMMVYDEFRMRCDFEYLQKHVRAMEILLNQNPIKLLRIAEIHQNLKERLELAPFPDHIYKLAAVMFFDETESPYACDMQYNQKKVAAWRSDPEMLPFLVKEPLKSLMPFLELPNVDLGTYFKVQDELTKMHQDKVNQVLSKVQPNESTKPSNGTLRKDTTTSGG